MAHRGPQVGLGPRSWISNIMLFLSSYTVLFAALALRFQRPHWLPIACWILFGVGLLTAVSMLTLWRRFAHDSIVIETVEDKGPDVGGYLATYILPLVVVETPTPADLWAFGLVLFTVAVIYVRSRLIQINPTLYFFGYRLFYVTTSHGFTGYLLSIAEPRPGEHRMIVQYGNVMLDLRLWNWCNNIMKTRQSP